ncbi:flavodoxin family protein [Nocardioides koreensis]|uniref:Flavodoxin family protein n=1 Tax=Nocardioides koreensis TaxID=433651 RepID=A0ABP5KWK6_9ACTN
MERPPLILCVSVSEGNTALVARAMAEVLRADVREPEDVDPHTLSERPLVGFGSGIFRGSHHARLRKYVERLPHVRGTRAFVYTTSGMGRSQSLPWQRSLESVLRDRGFEVVGSFSCRGFDTWLPLRIVGGLNKGHPDAEDLARAGEFAERIAEELPAR